MSWTTFQPRGSSSTIEDFQAVLEDTQELLEEASRLLELLLSTLTCSGACRAYTPGTARKETCNPTRTLTL
jgi:hypothetical protein